MAGCSLLAGAILLGIGARVTETADMRPLVEGAAPSGAEPLRSGTPVAPSLPTPWPPASRRGWPPTAGHAPTRPATRRHRSPVVVEVAGPDGVGQRRVVGRAECMQPLGVRGRDGRAPLELALDDRQARCAPPAPRSVPRPRRAPSPRPRGTRAPPRRARPPSGARRAAGRGGADRGGRGRVAGAPRPSRMKRSHSLSQTRRPMAASSTERVAPLRCDRGLEGADGGPFHRGVDLPPVDPVAVHRLAACGLVGAQQVVERAEAAHLAGATEAPGRRAQPADVLGRVAGVGQLPVEHAAQALGPDEQVPAAEVAVDRHPADPARDGCARASQRTPSSSAGRASPSRSRRAAGRPAGPPAAARRWRPGRSCGWRPPPARTARSARAGPRPTRGHAGSCAGSSRPRGARPPARRRRGRRPSPSPSATTAGTGTPARPRRLEQGALESRLAPPSPHRRRGPSAG